ncbi:hypothetical protein GCM10009551_074070 [Nocardiopsis tropica]
MGGLFPFRRGVGAVSCAREVTGPGAGPLSGGGGPPPGFGADVTGVAWGGSRGLTETMWYWLDFFLSLRELIEESPVVTTPRAPSVTVTRSTFRTSASQQPGKTTHPRPCDKHTRNNI